MKMNKIMKFENVAKIISLSKIVKSKLLCVIHLIYKK
jgi:hypothetical protein